MSVPPASSEVLERLLIEVVGDDSKLKAALDDAVKAAQAAAREMRDALAVDFSKVSQGADAATAAFNKIALSVANTNNVLEEHVTQSRKSFDTLRQAGEEAATKIQSALKVDFKQVEGDAQKVTTAVTDIGAGVTDLGKIFETQLKIGEREFDKIRAAGEMTEEQFEQYRQTVLDAIGATRPFAKTLGTTGESLDDLAKRIREATYEQSEASKETERTKRSQEELEDTIKRLSNEVRSSRNVWAGRITSDDEFRKSTGASREEILKLLPTLDRSSTEYRKLTQELAYAQRGLDSVNKVASRGGLAWTAQIALANQFGQQLRNLGPAGNAAAGALGLLGSGFSSLQAPLTMADFGLTKILGSLARLPGILALASGALMVGLGVGLARITTQAATYAREMENATHRTGLTVEGLQELQHAARSTGVPLDLLNTTMQRLQRRASDANAGNETLKRSFDRLGVTLTDNEGNMRSTEDLLGQVADGLNSVENNADKLALAFKIFDTEGGRLLPLLTEGSEGIRALREEARELGLVISGDTILSLSQFQAELETIKQQFEVVRVEVAAAFLPVFRDVLLPLIRDQFVPWLGNFAKRLNDMADAFFDAGSEGDAFRAKLAFIAARIQSVGQFLYSLGQLSVGLIQVLVAPFAALGDAIGQATVAADVFFDAYRRALTGDFSAFLKSPAAAIREAGVDLRRSVEALVEQAQLGFANLSAGGELFVGAFDFAGLEAEWLQRLEDAAENASRDAVPATRQALSELMDSAAAGVGTAPPPAGSIAAAEAMVRHFADAFRNASSNEARAVAAALRDDWQAVVDALLAPFAEADVLAAAKLWTGRLTAELREGAKNVVIDVIPLLQASLESLNAEAAEAFNEFGWDSTLYQDTITKIEFIEAYLESLRREYGVIPITFEPTVSVTTPSEVSLLPDLTLPEQTKSATAALVEYYTRLPRVADQQAKLTGTTEDTRTAWLETLDILEAILPGLDEMSDDWLTVTSLIIQARARLEELNDVLDAAPVDRLTGAFQTAAAAARSLWESARDSNLASELAGVAAAVGGLLGVTRGLRQGSLLAGALGQDFDATAAEVALLETEIRGLVERFDDLTVAERLRLQTASTRLKSLKDQRQAEADAAEATEAHTKAVTEWLAAVQAMGAGEDPLTARARELEAWLEAGVITLDEYRAMLAEVAAAQERLNATLNDAAFQAWADGVNRLGVNLDPVSVALGELGAMFAEGRISAEEYAAGVDLVNAALDRLAAADATAAVERVTEAWAAANDQLGDLLGLGASQFDELREAAVAAFDAGVIGAEELAKALELIGLLEVADGFRRVAESLGDVAGIIPNLASELTKAFAQFKAGSADAAIATVFNAATAAVQALGAAFEDAEHQAAATLDLIIGTAAGIATAIGSPALGQAVAAIGSFIKTILGDLSNGLIAIERQINQTASSSRWLGEGLIRGIADGATRTVSRGGILGMLGFTKQELDDDAYRAGISLAEGLAQGMVNTLRSGDFEEAWQAFIDDIIINGIIEAFIATALVQDAIEEALALIMGGDAAGGAAALDRLKDDFHQVWQTIQSITATPMPDQDDLERSVMFSLPDATVSVLAAPQWALELGTAASRMSDAGTAMLTAADMMQDVFDRGITVESAPQPRGIDAARSL